MSEQSTVLFITPTAGVAGDGKPPLRGSRKTVDRGQLIYSVFNQQVTLAPLVGHQSLKLLWIQVLPIISLQRDSPSRDLPRMTRANCGPASGRGCETQLKFLESYHSNFCLAGPAREIPSGQDKPIYPSLVANQNTGFTAFCLLADSAIIIHFSKALALKTTSCTS